MFIITATSLPVINKILGTNWVVGEDREFSYNRIQVFVAVILGILTAFTQYFKFRNTPKQEFGKKIIIPTVIALLAGIAISIWGGIDYDKYGMGFLIAIHLAIFSNVYAVIANAAYIRIGLKGRLKAAGGSVAHIGFGMMVAGMLISSSKTETLSMNFINPLNFGPDAKQKGVENMTLYQGVKMDMGKYWVTYTKDSATEKAKKIYYFVEFESKDGKEKFVLKPDLIKNTKGQEQYSNNPDAKHYLNRDVFTYISYAEQMVEGADTAQFRNHDVKVGDTIFYSGGLMRLDSVTMNPNSGKHTFTARDTAFMANLSVITSDQRKLKANPVFYLEDSEPRYVIDTVFSQGMAVAMKPSEKLGYFSVGVKESSRLVPFVGLKVLEFPFINLVWIGTVIMVIGFVMSLLWRAKLLR
jgi:cytochrome c-type biogenesis protein CcmF